MMDTKIPNKPQIISKIKSKSQEIGFTMFSDELVGTLLRTLVGSKSNANILELGTGIGLSLSWMIDALCKNSSLTTIDNDPDLIQIAQEFFGEDPRINIICEDGSKWIREYQGNKFDLVFADAWPGKYSDLDIILDLIKPSGFYVIDDMIKQPNWPEGHDNLVNQLIAKLEIRGDFNITKLNWSSGIIVMTKKMNL